MPGSPSRLQGCRRQSNAGAVTEKFRFINDHRAHYRVATMCRVLQASRSGFYAWLEKPKSDRTVEDERLLPLIRASYAASGGVYGAPRVFLDFCEVGETCGRHRVARLMRSHKIKAIRGYKAPRPIAGRPSHRAQSTATAVHCRAARSGLGNRHHLHTNLAGFSLSRRRDGSACPQDRWLVDETDLG